MFRLVCILRLVFSRTLTDPGESVRTGERENRGREIIKAGSERAKQMSCTIGSDLVSWQLFWVEPCSHGGVKGLFSPTSAEKKKKRFISFGPVCARHFL